MKPYTPSEDGNRPDPQLSGGKGDEELMRATTGALREKYTGRPVSIGAADPGKPAPSADRDPANKSGE